MARNADDTLSSFGVSPNTSAAHELDLSDMFQSLQNHRDAIKVFHGFVLEDEEVMSPVDTQEIFELFQNTDESASDLRFSQAIEMYNNDSGHDTGSPTCLNDTISCILDELGPLCENSQNLNLSLSWVCDSEDIRTDTAFEGQQIQWDSNGQRCPSPDIFADSISDQTESMKPYQIMNSNKGIGENVKSLVDVLKVNEHISESENTVLHTIDPKEFNTQSVLEFNSKSNSCTENTSEHIAVDEPLDPLETTHSTEHRTSGFGAITYDSKRSYITLEAPILPQKSPRQSPSHRTAAKPFIQAIIYNPASEKSDYTLLAPILSQQLLSSTSAEPATANPFIGDVVNDIDMIAVVPFESPIATHQTLAKPAPANPFSGAILYEMASKDSVVTKEKLQSPNVAPGNTLIENIISNSGEILLGQTTPDIQKNNVLCQGVVGNNPPLPTASINPVLVHSSSRESINKPEKSTTCPMSMFNADLIAERAHKNCPSMKQFFFAHGSHSHETRPDYTKFKKPSKILNKNENPNMDIDSHLEPDDNEVHMDETFSRTFEELQAIATGQLPHFFNEVLGVAETNSNNLSVDAGLNVDNKKINETVHNEIDMEDTFCRTFEESQFNQAMSSQLPYLFNEKHRNAETKIKNEEVNCYTIGQTEELLPTQSQPQTSTFHYSATQSIRNPQNAKDFSECFPKFASFPMKR